MYAEDFLRLFVRHRSDKDIKDSVLQSYVEIKLSIMLVDKHLSVEVFCLWAESVMQVSILYSDHIGEVPRVQVVSNL